MAPALPLAAVASTGGAHEIGEAIVGIDTWVAEALHTRATPALTDQLRLVTQLGDATVLFCVASVVAAALIAFGSRRDVVVLLGALAGAELLTWAFKALFRRDRPAFADPLASASWFSYPSGHAAAATAAYGAVAYVLARRLRSPAAQAGCVAAAAALVGAIGFSRVYLGVHYLSDVLAGLATGLACLLLAVLLAARPAVRERGAASYGRE